MTDSTTSNLNLESHLLLNNGLTIETQAGMGRVAVATKTLDTLYTTILRERPLLVWNVGDMEDFLVQFKSAPLETQSIIMDMFHPPLDSPCNPTMVKLKNMAVSLAETTGDPVSWIHQLLAICATNAHQYCSGKTTRQDHSALFSYASKMAHSCIPNLAYTSVREDDDSFGALEYTLIRPIPQGQPAAFSYIGGGKLLYQTPTDKRREKLLQTKSFWCQCPRCIGPDYCRSIQCLSCQKTYIPCIYVNVENEDDNKDEDNQHGADSHKCIHVPTWTCQDCNCNAVLDSHDVELLEKQISDRLEALKEKQEEHSDSNHDHIRQLEELVTESRQQLSPVHHITIQSLETLAQWCRQARAGSTEHTDTNVETEVSTCTVYTKAELGAIAVVAGVQVVLACECVAAGCSGCFDPSSLSTCTSITPSATFAQHHDLIYQMGVTMFQASKDLMGVPAESRSKPAMALIQRYLPVMAQMARMKDEQQDFSG